MDEIEKPKPVQPQPFTPKSKVIAEFVDEIPKPKDRSGNLRTTSWEVQPGVREALIKAFNNPGKAMILVEYDAKGLAPSKRRSQAKLRVMALERQGYTEQAGWVVKAVDNKVYVLYQGLG